MMMMMMVILLMMIMMNIIPMLIIDGLIQGNHSHWSTLPNYYDISYIYNDPHDDGKKKTFGTFQMEIKSQHQLHKNVSLSQVANIFKRIANLIQSGQIEA